MQKYLDGSLTLGADSPSQFVCMDELGQGLFHCEISECLKALLQTTSAAHAHFPSVFNAADFA